MGPDKPELEIGLRGAGPDDVTLALCSLGADPGLELLTRPGESLELLLLAAWGGGGAIRRGRECEGEEDLVFKLSTKQQNDIIYKLYCKLC